MAKSVFTVPLDKIAKDVEKEIAVVNEKRFRAVGLDLFASVVVATPVDKGGARGGWQESVSAPQFIAGVVPNKNKSLLSLPKNPKLLPYFLSNPLPYIEKLEFGGYGDGPKTTGGFSKQAPRGMIRVNMQRLGLL